MKTRFIKRKYPKFYIFAAFTLLCFLAVGYSYINSDLGIEANALASSNRWNIVISNMQVNSASTYGTQNNNSTGSQLTFDLSLTTVNQSYIIDFDVTNNGTLKAYLDKIDYNLDGYYNLNNYLEYKYKYNDGTDVKVGDTLEPNQTKHMKLYINYNKNIPYEYIDISTNSLSLTYGINIKYDFASKTKYKIGIFDGEDNLINDIYATSSQTIEIENQNNNKVFGCINSNISLDNEKIIISNFNSDIICKFADDISTAINYEKLDQDKYEIGESIDNRVIILDDITEEGKLSGTYIHIDLNGNNVDFVPFDHTDDSSYLEIVDITNTSTVTIQGKFTSYQKSVYIDGGTYIFTVKNDYSESFSELYINNANVQINTTSEKGFRIRHNKLVINNSQITSNYTPFYIINYDDNWTSSNTKSYPTSILIKNSTITSQNGSLLKIYTKDDKVDSQTMINICKSRINTNTTDIPLLSGQLIYSTDTVFNHGSPVINNMTTGTFVLENDIACEIVNEQIGN